jgi:hypothetical protein
MRLARVSLLSFDRFRNRHEAANIGVRSWSCIDTELAGVNRGRGAETAAPR